MLENLKIRFIHLYELDFQIEFFNAYVIFVSNNSLNNDLIFDKKGKC